MIHNSNEITEELKTELQVIYQRGELPFWDKPLFCKFGSHDLYLINSKGIIAFTTQFLCRKCGRIYQFSAENFL